MVLVDSYSETNVSTTQSIRTGLITFYGQSFTAIAGVLNSTAFSITRTGTISGNCYSRIYTHSGTYGTSSVGIGTKLAESDPIDVTTLSTSTTLVTFTFSGLNKITLINNSKYVVVFVFEGTGDASNKVTIGIDTTSPTHSGNATFFDGGWNANVTSDVPFYVYVDDIFTPKVIII